MLQVPKRNSADSEASLESFILYDVPVFSLIGNKTLIDPLSDYDIDEDARLVFKFMKAYKTERINTLYFEGLFNQYLIVPC